MTATLTNQIDDRLLNLSLIEVPESDLDRSVPLKEQAKACRALFKKLEIRGVSVTAPRYSMASSVQIDLPPTIGDHPSDTFPHSMGTIEDDPHCPTCDRRNKARAALEKILDVAFPNFRDRSGDEPDDYYDFCWSIH